MKLISVVIVTYNSEELIYDCIDSLLKYNDIGEGLEVIIIDNSSEDTYKRMSSKILNDYGSVIKTQKSPGNIGFGRANNLGSKSSNGEVLLFLNPDTICIMPILSKTYNLFMNDPKVATAGLQLYDEKRRKQISFFFIKGYISPLLNSIVKILNKINYKLSNMITSGSCLFVRSDIFTKIEGFNENIFLYQEESYLSHKIKKLSNSFKLVYLPELKIIHKEKKEKISDFLMSEHYKAGMFYYNYFGYNTNIVKLTHNLFFNLKAFLLFLSSNKPELQHVKKESQIFNSFFKRN